MSDWKREGGRWVEVDEGTFFVQSSKPSFALPTERGCTFRIYYTDGYSGALWIDGRGRIFDVHRGEIYDEGDRAFKRERIEVLARPVKAVVAEVLADARAEYDDDLWQDGRGFHRVARKWGLK